MIVDNPSCVIAFCCLPSRELAETSLGSRPFPFRGEGLVSETREGLEPRLSRDKARGRILYMGGGVKWIILKCLSTQATGIKDSFHRQALKNYQNYRRFQEAMR